MKTLSIFKFGVHFSYSCFGSFLVISSFFFLLIFATKLNLAEGMRGEGQVRDPAGFHKSLLKAALITQGWA